MVQRNRLGWCGHVLREDDDDWVKECVSLEVEGARQRGSPRKTWKEVVDKDMDDVQLKLSKWTEIIRLDGIGTTAITTVVL